ncbi:MAG: hypothetical protein ACYTEZ_15630 [Planctomycetota bacterium]
MIEFLESGKDNIPRNRMLTFRFSGPVASLQDFPERLKIQNVQRGANSNFARAVGTYVGGGGTHHLDTTTWIATGGGGGGFIEIFASGTILATGRAIDASGGAGGKGAILPTAIASYNIDGVVGGGGGGGGAISLISGDDIILNGALLDARGGPGGRRAFNG